MTSEAVGLAGQLGAAGILAWLVVYATKKTIPGLLNTFKDALAQQREDFRAFVTEQREFFSERIDAEHKRFDQITKFMKEQNDNHEHQPPH